MAGRVWPTGRAKWQGDHAATWAPVWGATCRGVERSIRTVNRGIFSPISTRPAFLFLPCGTMFHTVLPFAGDVAAWWASDRVRTALIAWTWVHAIIKSRRVREKGGGQ